MSRMRVEGLLAAFPKLVGHSKQHTFVETDTVRYVYQPLENQMYLLLITTKTSNIVEDLGTLRLLAKVVPDVAGGITENAVNTNAFELIFAFDEVLTVGGYKEDITLSTIQKNLIMDSHEEKVHLAIEKKKQDEAKKAMEERANEIKKAQMEQLKKNLVDGIGGQGGPGVSSGPSGGMVGFGSDSAGYGPGSNMGGFGSGGSFDYQQKVETPAVDEEPRKVAKGMQLGGMGKAKKKSNLLAAVAMEDNFSVMAGSNKADALGLSAAPAPPPPSTPLTVVLEEKYSVSMNREGGIDACDMKGSLSLTANTEVGAMASIAVNKPQIASKCTDNWSITTHPKVNKPTYEKTGVISLKGSNGLPLNRAVNVLKWSYKAKDAAPLTINCWPEDDGSGSMIVNIEYELTRMDMTLHDINILFPVGTTESPTIEAIDGQYKFDAKSGMMCWHQDVIDSNNSSGSLEFIIPGSDEDAFFPVQVMFKSQSLLCPIEILGVTSIANGSPIPHDLSKNVIPESYVVQ